jgi:DNA-binding MarR family transcriptional regulator
MGYHFASQVLMHQRHGTAVAHRQARYSVRSPWPREALQFVDAVERGSRWVRAARRRVSGAYGLSVAQWRLLKALRQENDSSRGPSVAQLARRLAVKRQTAHRTAVELQRSGLLQLAPRSTDRRTLVATLTPTGERSLQVLESTIRALLLEVTNDLSPNVLDITTDALTRMSTRLRSLPLMNGAPRLARRRGGEGIPKKSSQHC